MEEPIFTKKSAIKKAPIKLLDLEAKKTYDECTSLEKLDDFSQIMQGIEEDMMKGRTSYYSSSSSYSKNNKTKPSDFPDTPNIDFWRKFRLTP